MSKLQATPPQHWRTPLKLSEGIAMTILTSSTSIVAVLLTWSTVREQGLPKIPFWGNGVCYSWLQYDESMRASGVDDILGGLIKPWIL